MKKSVTVTVQIQLDIESNGKDVENVIEILDYINEDLGKNYSEWNPQIFTRSIDYSDILGSDDETDEDDMSTKTITAEDVRYVARYKCKTLTEREICRVVEVYPSIQETDSTITWDKIVERILDNLEK